MPSGWKLTWCLCADPGRPKISSPVHLLLKPPDAELLGHAFKQKQFRRSRPCNLCHQPVKKSGSSCRVCKYTCHRTCEPKVWRACRHGNPSLKNGTEPLMSRPSSGPRQVATSPSRRMDPPPAPGSPSSSVDLSFVTERILALSFPAELDSLTYRDALHQAATMLQTKHGDNYMVFNLSQPRKEIGQWNPRVLDVGWPDQLAPPLERLCSVCRALDSWLQADPQHVAVLHSKCGVERVGVVVAAYCEYTGLCPPNQQDQQSLDRFSMKRFLNERVAGLRGPSDKRYVEYFAGLLSGAIQVNSSPLFLDHVTVVGIPAFQSNGGCRAFFKVYQGSVPVHTSAIYNVHDSARHFTMSLGERGLALRGDILVKCYHRHRQPVDGRETVFSLQFHTCAVTQQTLVFQRQDLDDACQDLRFPLDGSVRLHFSSGPESRLLLGVNETHGRYSVEPSTGDPVVRWDSYDAVNDASCQDDHHHHDLSSSARTSQNADHGRLAHTYGPLDGSLYAKVLKHGTKTPPSSPPLVVATSSASGERSASRFSDPSSSTGSGADYHPLQHHHHHHHLHDPGAQFLNSPHVASTDSGISSAGVVRSGGGSSTHNRDLGSGSASASPPHSGRSAELSAVGAFDTPATPSPIQHIQQQQQQQATSTPLHRMPSIVETRAEVHANGATPMAPPSLAATAELDQLLSGMLMNVQNIPDVRPEHRHLHRASEIDIDSIQVNFDLTPHGRDVTDRRAAAPAPPPPARNNSTPGSAYVYESDTVRRACPTPSAAAKVQPPPPATSATSATSAAEDIPYHAREDSKPFTYGMVTNGHHHLQQQNGGSGASGAGCGPTGPSLQRHDRKESSGAGQAPPGRVARELESPSLVRKFSTAAQPPPATSPRPVRKLGEPLLNGSPPPPPPANPASGVLPVATSSPRLDAPRNRSASHGHVESPAPISLEETIQDTSTSPDSSRMSSDVAAGLTWLQRQQQKLRERKDSMRRAERHPQEARLLSELRSSHQFKGQQQQLHQQQQAVSSSQRPVDDAGYLSDVTMFSELDMVNTSREGSPDIRSAYATPLHINTAGSYGQYQQSKTGQNGSGANKPVSTSSPNSPLLTHRSSSLERSGRYLGPGGGQPQPQRLTLTRQKSDMSHDRERPFVSVKRAHEQQAKALNSANGGQPSPYELLVGTSPYGTVGYHQRGSLNTKDSSDGLLSTVADARPVPSSPPSPAILSAAQPVSRAGNLDRLIRTLNTNLPDPAALLREPNLSPNLKHMISTRCNTTSSNSNNNNNNNDDTDNDNGRTLDKSRSNNSTPTHARLNQQVAFADDPASLNKHQIMTSSHARNPTSTPSNTNSPKFTSDSVMSWNSSLSGDLDLSGNRPVTPAFPVVPRTPYLNVHHHGRQSIDSPVTPTSSHSGAGLPPKSPTAQRKERSPSPSPSSAYLGYSQSRRSSVQSEPQEVNPVHVNFAKDTSRFWYKPNIAREDAINLLKDQAPGTFIVRDSNSFAGAFGLALKVATPPPHATAKNPSDPSTELVRHFLIEPTSKGVRIKGCSNEPVFGSLSALIYQHSVTPLALPIKLVLPEGELALRDGSATPGQTVVSPTAQLLVQGAACSLLYLFTMDTESLTGPQAIQRTMAHLLDSKPLPTPTVVHFKVSAQGITLTDNERKLFFRRHYPVITISHCGLDPEDRRWNQRSEETGLPISSNRCFGFVARKPASKTDNQCHIFAELEAEQPATAIVNFVTKVMMTASASSHSKNNV